MSLQLGITASPQMPDMIDYVVQAEQLGAASVWLPEFWGHDALVPLGALSQRTERIRLGTAIVQLGSRTPATLAMSAFSLQQLSGGRFVLGVGTSGPQVMEGWHGVRFDRPVMRTRETIEILRLATSGRRTEFHGEVYQLPLPGGEGRALRAAADPTSVPIHVAALGPANLRLTGELADGWIGNSFLCEHAEVFFGPIAEGAAAAGRTLDDIDLTVSVSCEITDDVEEAGRRHAAGYAFTFGAMGSATTNFYNRAFARQGFGDAVAEVQRLWRSGDREAASEAVPIEIGLRTNLIGPPEEILRRLREYRDCGVDELRLNPMGDTLDEQLDGLGQLLDLLATVNAEDDGPPRTIGTSAPRVATAPIYDRIGKGYSAKRVPEPTWVAQVHAALGDAASVLNIGAGSGNYEPTDRRVVAVEPSWEMLSQRRDAAPAIRGVAERLPFRDRSFDAAMGTLTVHHWTDRVAGLQELRRVADRQVLVVYDPAVAHRFWMVEYFPEALDSPLEADAPTPDGIAEVLDVVDVQTMWIPADCSDGVAAAYWRRPEAYLDPAVQQSMSLLALLPQEVLARGSARLRADLDDGTWMERHGHLLELDRADYGYRLVIAAN